MVLNGIYTVRAGLRIVRAPEQEVGHRVVGGEIAAQVKVSIRAATPTALRLNILGVIPVRAKLQGV